MAGLANPGPSDTPAVAPDPVARIQALLDLEKPQPKETKPEPKEQAQPVQEEPSQTEGEAQAQEQAEPEAEPAQNQQVEGQADERPIREIPLDELEAIELELIVKDEGGTDVTLKPTIKELKKGYMMEKDYQRKTKELARLREEAAETARKSVESERTQYQQNLQTLHNLVLETAASELKDVNWNDLATNDPLKYVQVRNRADQLANVLTGIQAKMKEADTKSASERKSAIETQARKARAELERDLPNFNDAYYQTLMKSGESVGFKPEEVATWIDPRAIKLLDKAYKYDQLQAGKPPATKKVIVTPKTVKSGPSQENTRAQQKETDALKRLRSNGTIENAADVIRSRLG